MGERSLQDFVHEVNGGSHLRVEHDFGDGFVRLRTSEAERRQAAQDIQCSEHIVLELLRNSRDAHASHVFMAVSKDGAKRSITVIDDGDGIPGVMHAHVFEPRVTSKLDTSHMDAWGLHGRGMALYSISENALSACVAASDVGLGCSMKVETDVNRLPEKKDQSGFPRFELDENGTVNVRGPKNILRTSCEFAIECRDSCSVHVGSPAEIASTLYAYGKATLSAIDRAFCRDVNQLPLVKRLATASDPGDFAEIAANLGLDVSTRTARRVMDGQLGEASPLLEMISITAPAGRGGNGGKKRQTRRSRVKIQKADSQAFSAELMKPFAELAEKYYLDAGVEPTVRVSNGCLSITIPLVEMQ